MTDSCIDGFSVNNHPDNLYTSLAYIKQEVDLWRSYFKDKVVLCNCDDPYESYFFKYFVHNFKALQLKKLICTSYENSPIAGRKLCFFDPQSPYNRKAYIIELTEADIADKILNPAHAKAFLQNGINSFVPLNGNGDFRSYECMDILKKADVAVTHPPFSLLHKYIELMMNFRKKFLLIGNASLIGCREITNLIKQKKLIFRPAECRNFRQSSAGKFKFFKAPDVGWFTNLPFNV